MTQPLMAYALTALAFFALDYLWLTRFAKRFYFDRLGTLLLKRPKFVAAGGFYAVYVAGIVIFAVAPALTEQSAPTALIHGALFGFFAYATYDMTNYATLKGWSLTVSLVDIAWGAFVTGTAALFGYSLVSLITAV